MEQTQVSSQSEAPPEKARLSSAIPAANCQGHEDIFRTRDEAVHEEPSTLCSRCSSIDVESLFVYIKEPPYEAIKLMSLGKLGIEAELSSCSLCRLFYAVRIPDDDYPSVDDYALYVTPAPPLHHPWYGLVLAVVQKTGDAFEGWRESFELEDMGNSHGFIACSEGSDTSGRTRSLREPFIDARAIDFNILRGWVQRCGQQHKRFCVQFESSASSLKDMKSIDCELRQIVPALPSYKYCALSYVWGTSKSGHGDQCVRNILPTTLPRTIEDALKVTQELGLRYIWIDRYCIDQENDDEKQVQIRQMDLVYQNAFVTIVAAAGTDPHFGLPGVGATSRTPQPTAWVGRRCLVSTLPDPKRLIKTSKWMQRAWTYQESLFSTRCIIFTEQQVFFQCRSGMTRETVGVFQPNMIESFPGPGGMSKTDPSSICDRLEEYCGRELSVESDAIRAFEGVFHNHRIKHHVHQFLGIPIMPPTKKRYMEDTYRRRAEAFAIGLAWCNKAQGTRRSLFPSWSWAGWTVPIKYKHILFSYGVGIRNERPLRFFIEKWNGSLEEMDDRSDALLDQGIFGGPGRFIHIEAWTIPIDVRYMPKGAEELQYHRHLYDDGSGYLARFPSDEGAIDLPVYTLYRKHENGVTKQPSFTPDFEQGSLLGIVLGQCEEFPKPNYFDAIFIMVVHEKEHYCERVGHILLIQDRERWLRNGYEPPKFTDRELQTIFRSKKRRTIRLG